MEPMKTSVIDELISKHYRRFRVGGRLHRATWTGASWVVMTLHAEDRIAKTTEHASSRKIAEAAGLV